MRELQHALTRLIARQSLSSAEIKGAVSEIFDGAPDSLTAAFLVALEFKAASGEELAGAAQAMLQRALPLDLCSPNILDTAGTGGDGAGTFNISTGAALVGAAAGAHVAKHGNRAASGKLGAADVLERLGVKIDLESDGLRRCFERAGMCFVFAQKYHPVMARVGPLRRELGVPTLFNLLGPLCNAARPSRQLIGVSEPHRLVPMAEAAKALGVERALVVHGRDHVDEISVSEPTLVVEVREGRILPEREIKPEDFGVRRSARSAIVPNGPDEAIAMLKHALGGEPSPARDALVLNGGAAIYLAGLTDSLASGIASATELLSNGAPLDALEKLRQESNRDSQ